MKTRSKLLSATVAAALMLAPLASFAQSTSESNSGANAGSVSGASNNNSTTNGPQTTNVAVDPVNNGNGQARSDSASTANSGSASQSYSAGGASDSRSTATGGTSSASGGTSSAQNGSTTAANQQNITFNSTTPSKTTVRAAPTVYAPALTTTLTETCMGSTSAAGSGVGFGFSLGSTWRDKECVRRLNAREMAQTLGDRDAARALLCQDEDIAKAYESVGIDCHMRTVAVNTTPPAPAPYAQPVPDDSKMEPIPNPAPKPYGERGSLDKDKFRTDQPDKLASASH